MAGEARLCSLEVATLEMSLGFSPLSRGGGEQDTIVPMVGRRWGCTRRFMCLCQGSRPGGWLSPELLGFKFLWGSGDMPVFLRPSSLIRSASGCTRFSGPLCWHLGAEAGTDAMRAFPCVDTGVLGA